MKDLKKLYPEGFFAKREWLRGRSRDIVRISKELFDPKSTIDLGCGAGDLTDIFLNSDVDAYGLEGTENCAPEILFPLERLLIADLRKPMNGMTDYFYVKKDQHTTGRYVDTDYTKCIGCHICADVCPTGYIDMAMGDH